MNTTENIVFEHENKQIIQTGKHFFTRVLENGEFFESQDFNSLERAKKHLNITSTIEENNVLIAVFMGYIDNGCSLDGFLINPITNFDEEIKELKYNTSFDWLMQVVEKIFKGFYKLNPCPIYLKMNIEKQLIATDKEGIYNTCIEFIKWYNQQNQ